ncbi:hypothetical protein T484DRAFT_1833131, partial [Baffinella frigidus]
VFRERTADLVYLSPDAEEVLEVLRPGTLYVIGGIVDKTVRRGVSRGVARDLDLPCFRLPIQASPPLFAGPRPEEDIQSAPELRLAAPWQSVSQ